MPLKRTCPKSQRPSAAEIVAITSSAHANNSGTLALGRRIAQASSKRGRSQKRLNK